MTLEEEVSRFLAITVAMIIDSPEGAEKVARKIRTVLGLSPNAAITADRVTDAATRLKTQAREQR